MLDALITCVTALFLANFWSQWRYRFFDYFCAVAAIVGAFALVYPGLASIGALWLGFNMVCAVVVCLAVLHTNPAPAIILVLLNALIVYLRRDELASLAGTLLGRR